MPMLLMKQMLRWDHDTAFGKGAPSETEAMQQGCQGGNQYTFSSNSAMRKRRGREAALPLLCSFSYCRHVKLSKMSLGITEVAQHLKNFLSSIQRCVIFSELYTQPISFWYCFIFSLLSLSNTTYKFLRPRIELPGRCSCRNELCEICMHIRC